MLLKSQSNSKVVGTVYILLGKKKFFIKSWTTRPRPLAALYTKFRAMKGNRWHSWIPDSMMWTTDPKNWIQDSISLDFRFQKIRFPGVWILRLGFRIPKVSTSWKSDSTSKSFLVPESRLLYRGRQIWTALKLILSRVPYLASLILPAFIIVITNKLQITFSLIYDEALLQQLIFYDVYWHGVQ